MWSRLTKITLNRILFCRDIWKWNIRTMVVRKYVVWYMRAFAQSVQSLWDPCKVHTDSRAKSDSSYQVVPALGLICIVTGRRTLKTSFFFCVAGHFLMHRYYKENLIRICFLCVLDRILLFKKISAPICRVFYKTLILKD